MDDARLARRFFDRQRTEILDRIAELEDVRRSTPARLALVASFLVAAVLVAGGLLDGPATGAHPLLEAEVWAFADPTEIDDPLAAFGAWDGGAGNETPASALDRTPLPPLHLALGDDDFGASSSSSDDSPFLPPATGDASAGSRG
jgi:hypothetical protein